MTQGSLDLRDYIVLEGQQKFGQPGEALFTASTDEALNLTPGFISVGNSYTPTSPMAVDFTIAAGTDGNIILCWMSRVW